VIEIVNAMPRSVAGATLAAIVAGLAWRLRSLSWSGALAAVLVGAAAAAAGWRWAALLIAWFVVSAALSSWRAAAREARTRGVVAKRGARDAVQVAANGALFVGGALLNMPWPGAGWDVFALGALATAAADTWATEIGTLAPHQPRSILTLSPVVRGMSGGVTAVGTLALVVGALAVAGGARLLGWPGTVVVPVALGGVVGALLDSILGATIQERRRCNGCGAPTERQRHSCGSSTQRTGGIRWVSNDMVNVFSGVAGGALAWLLSR